MANSGVVQQEGYLLIQRKALVYYFKPGVHLQLAVVCVYACMYVCLFVFPHPREQTFYLKLESSLYTNNEGLTKPILHSRTDKLSENCVLGLMDIQGMSISSFGKWM